MLRFPNQSVLADAEDLTLARECIADLRSADFRGTSRITRRPARDDLELGSGAFGTVTGAAIAQSLMVGSVIGALLAGLIVAVLPLSMSSFPVDIAVVATSVGLGGLLGALLRSRFLKEAAVDSGAKRSRFVVCCEGEPAELARAFDILSSSACHTVSFNEGANGIETPSPLKQAGPSASSSLSRSMN